MFEKFIKRTINSAFQIEEKIFFNRPYKIKGFDSIKEADKWVSDYYKPMNLVQMCKVSDISEKEAELYIACSDSGYIYSIQSPYYSKASRALRDAIKYKYCVVFI
jgi:hypothetical protein